MKIFQNVKQILYIQKKNQNQQKKYLGISGRIVKAGKKVIVAGNLDHMEVQNMLQQHY